MSDPGRRIKKEISCQTRTEPAPISRQNPARTVRVAHKATLGPPPPARAGDKAAADAARVADAAVAPEAVKAGAKVADAAKDKAAAVDAAAGADKAAVFPAAIDPSSGGPYPTA